MFAGACDEDVPAIVALMNRAYRGAGAAAGWCSEADYLSGDRTTQALLREELRTHPDASLLKWIEPDADPIVGCVWLQPLGEHVWYLGSLASDPARQASGLGRRMLGAAEDWLRERGAHRVRITVVNVRAPLIAWYLRRGYRLTGERQPFPYGDDRFGIPLRDDLSFVVLEKDLGAA